MTFKHFIATGKDSPDYVDWSGGTMQHPVEFSYAVVDIGHSFSTDTSLWRPGLDNLSVLLKAQLTLKVSGPTITYAELHILKNFGLWRQIKWQGSIVSGLLTLPPITASDVAQRNDLYGVALETDVDCQIVFRAGIGATSHFEGFSIVPGGHHNLAPVPSYPV